MPASPPIFPTPENVFDNAIATGADYVSTVPPFVEVHIQFNLGKSDIDTYLQEWARDPRKVNHMRKMKGVVSMFWRILSCLHNDLSDLWRRGDERRGWQLTGLCGYLLDSRIWPVCLCYSKRLPYTNSFLSSTEIGAVANIIPGSVRISRVRRSYLMIEYSQSRDGLGIFFDHSVDTKCRAGCGGWEI